MDRSKEENGLYPAGFQVEEKQHVINTTETIGVADMMEALYDLKKNGISFDLSKEDFVRMVYLGFKFQGEDEPSKDIREALEMYEACEENKKVYLSTKGRQRFLEKTKKIKSSDVMDIVLVFSGMILLFVGTELLPKFQYTGLVLLAAGVIMYLPLIWQCLRQRGKLKMDIRKAKAKAIVLEEMEKETSEMVDAIHKKYMMPIKDGHLLENLKNLLAEATEYERLKEYNNFNNNLLKNQPLACLQPLMSNQPALEGQKNRREITIG